MQRERRSGNAMIEFTLVGIPVLFAVISIFEIARGMWNYHTLSYAVREGARFAAVHGENCSAPPNQCTATVAQIAGKIRLAGVGLLPEELRVTISSTSQTVACNPLSSCLSNGTVFPSGAGAAETLPVKVEATYPFRSAIAMFWPGSRAVSAAGTFNLYAVSEERIQF